MAAGGTLIHQHVREQRPTHQAMMVALSDARAHTVHPFSIVHPEALYDRPIPERHRLICYIGHLEAFDWNLISASAMTVSSPRASLDKLFAFGIDPVDGNLPSDIPS